jgi:hypothetical protein
VVGRVELAPSEVGGALGRCEADRLLHERGRRVGGPSRRRPAGGGVHRGGHVLVGSAGGQSEEADAFVGVVDQAREALVEMPELRERRL